jgi:hypothetical protein
LIESSSELSTENAIVTENRSTNVVTTRLKLNKDFSILVTQNYNQSNLVSVNYQIVPKITGDKYGVLDLSLTSEPVKRIDIFDATSTIGSGVQYSPISSPGGTIEYTCTCKSEGDCYDDCVFQTVYAKLKQCEGNLCHECSLSMSGRSTSGVDFITNTAVILPVTF